MEGILCVDSGLAIPGRLGWGGAGSLLLDAKVNSGCSRRKF